MSSSPYVHQNRGCRLAKLRGFEGFFVFQRIGSQNYLMWREGVAVTEVRCIQGRWYWRGGALNWSATREEAAISGWHRKAKGARFDGKPLEPWSAEAQKAMDDNKAHNVRGEPGPTASKE